jgi:GT2 family glycosyltransferase
MDLPIVNIIILNWKGWSDTLECLNSIYRIDYPHFNIIVVDNDSQDESVQRIKDWVIKRKNNNKQFRLYELNFDQKALNKTTRIPSKNKLFFLQNSKNWGFAEGNNKAIKILINNKVGDYVLLLNNDTVVSKDFLEVLVTEGEKHSSIGLLGPKTYYYNYKNKKNVIWSGGGYINWFKYPGYFSQHENQQDNNKKEESSVCDWVSGACLLIKMKIKIPKDELLLNKAYFFGCEDVDLALRLKERNILALYVPQSRIWHKVSRSRPLTIRQVIRSTKTNLKFNRLNNKYFWLFFLLYLIQIPMRYIILLFRKISSNR